MITRPHDWRPRVVVCGTRFGRVYLSAFRDPELPLRLVGILARGSGRSHRCADAYGVPLYLDPDALPDDVDIACVVVRAGLNGGAGGELACRLMARGIHVLQEHPLHHEELAVCLRTAHARRVVYRLNTHYVHLEPVRRFIRAARALFREQRPLFVEATCGLPTAFTLFDLLGQLFGGVRPWAFATPSRPDEALRGVCERASPFRTLEGMIAGVPFTLRLQHQLAPAEPDNHVHLFHRVTVGTEGGTLTLVNTHGPTIWSPRPHLPSDAADAVGVECSSAPHLDYPTAMPIGPATGPSYREILHTTWPAGVRRTLRAMRRAILDGDDSRQHGQYCLSLSRLWQDATSRLGAVELLRQDAPHVLPADLLYAAAAAPEDEEAWT